MYALLVANSATSTYVTIGCAEMLEDIKIFIDSGNLRGIHTLGDVREISIEETKALQAKRGPAEQELVFKVIDAFYASEASDAFYASEEV
jgi:hypothetical protein